MKQIYVKYNNKNNIRSAWGPAFGSKKYLAYFGDKQTGTEIAAHRGTTLLIRIGLHNVHTYRQRIEQVYVEKKSTGHNETVTDRTCQCSIVCTETSHCVNRRGLLYSA